MIKVSELRIGNAIWDDTLNKIKWVAHRVISDLASHANPLPYSPILLTPDWMAKCGFEWNPEGQVYCIQVGNTVYLEYDVDFNCSIVPETWRGQPLHLWGDNKYLHKLQNIYFALTGEELTIK